MVQYVLSLNEEGFLLLFLYNCKSKLSELFHLILILSMFFVLKILLCHLLIIYNALQNPSRIEFSTGFFFQNPYLKYILL